MATDPRDRASESESTPSTDWRRWLSTPRGQIALAVLFFGLTEALALPVVVLGLMVLPVRDGLPVLSAAPGVFWVAVALVVLIPAATAGYIYVRLRGALRRAEQRGQRGRS